jgi:hypothetical protein
MSKHHTVVGTHGRASLHNAAVFRVHPVRRPPPPRCSASVRPTPAAAAVFRVHSTPAAAAVFRVHRPTPADAAGFRACPHTTHFRIPYIATIP